MFVRLDPCNASGTVVELHFFSVDCDDGRRLGRLERKKVEVDFSQLGEKPLTRHVFVHGLKQKDS